MVVEIAVGCTEDSETKLPKCSISKFVCEKFLGRTMGYPIVFDDDQSFAANEIHRVRIDGGLTQTSDHPIVDCEALPRVCPPRT